ncbi:RNA polymerase sigma factor [Kitasatospora sp. NPDC049285]|uniref:RNA polymerase sigma factor n=1 Tax=Kitasatospora sp. NPDC049285 TaxID=3157096 RepID=UPI0034464257
MRERESRGGWGRVTPSPEPAITEPAATDVSTTVELTTPEGFTAFYREQIDDILGFVTRRVSDPHLAADLTADIFLAALEAAASYRPDRGTPAGWLYGIARNVIAGHCRGDTRERQAMGRLQGRRLLGEEDILALEERIDAQRAARALAERHAELSPPLRAVLDAVAVDGLTTAQAAERLGISQTTVRVRLHRARRRLGVERTGVPESAAPETTSSESTGSGRLLSRVARPADPIIEVTS